MRHCAPKRQWPWRMKKLHGFVFASAMTVDGVCTQCAVHQVA